MANFYHPKLLLVAMHLVAMQLDDDILTSRAANTESLLRTAKRLAMLIQELESVL